MPTRSSRSSARRRAACSLMPRCSIRTSVIWRAILRCGLSEVIGSWKIMASLDAADLRSAASPAARAAPGRGSGRCRCNDRCLAKSPMTERKAWVLPEPLSPTTPTLSPASMLKQRPLTAATSPSAVANRVVRSWTSRTGAIRRSLSSSSPPQSKPPARAWRPTRRDGPLPGRTFIAYRCLLSDREGDHACQIHG